MNQRLTDIRRAQLDQLLAGGGDPKKADSEYTLMGAPRQENEHKPYPKTERMNLGVKAVKSGLDRLNRLIDQGPSVRDVLGNVVGAVPFVGPDLRKGMEDSTLTIPYGFETSPTNPRVATGIQTAKLPTTDILDALKMSDITGGTGASNLLGSVGKGYAPNPMDVLDTLGLGAAGYGAAKVGAKGAKLAGRGALKALEQAGTGPTAGSMAAQRGVIKMPGGNFLTGRVEKDVEPLRQQTGGGNDPAEMLRQMREKYTPEAIESLPDISRPAVIASIANLEKDAAINKWIDSNLSNYIKKQMGTPDDPVRALAEQGITHKADLLHEDPVFADKPIMDQRREAGFPEEGMAQSDLAKAWEYVSDSSIASHRAGDIQGMPEKFTKHNEAERKMIAARDALDRKFLNHIEKEIGLNDKEAASLVRGMTYDEKARLIGDQDLLQTNIDYQATHDPMMSSYIALGRENPWIAKVAPETQVYSPYTGDLGFDHIVDVLKQDVAEGRIRPEQLNKVSMEQAVRRTHEYDQEMAKKMAETQAKVTEGMPVHKEYPEGYKWIELALPETPTGLPEGWKLAPNSATEKAGIIQAVSPDGVRVLGKDMPDLVKNLYRRHPDTPGNPRQQLEQALKYEGDTMGHCVGGYCPDVLEGRSRIYSLRDAKGEPHVTIETKPGGGHEYAGEKNKEIIRLAEERGIQKYMAPGNEALWAEAEKNLAERGITAPQYIQQIKGKGNRAPKEEYLPFVQDFVKGGNWSDVGDFRNTGLIRKSDLIDKFSPDELDAIGSGEYLTKAEHDDLLLKALRPPEEGMAGGGSVGLKNALNNLLRTDKPEVHMALGGITNVANVAGKAAKVKHPLVFPRAAAKSLEDIRPIAQRIAEQMTGDFVRQHPNPKVSTNPAGKSRKQFEREQNIPMETRNLVPPADVPVLDYEKKMGNVLLGVPGDPTLGGVLEAGSLENVAKPTVELTRVGDVTPEHPVPLFGGPRYGDENRFWASNYGAAVPIQNRADKLSDLYESPVLGQYIKMAPDSANFALHNLDALLAIQQPEKLSKAKMEKLNREIKAGSPKYGKFPGFVGFEDPIDVLLQSQLDSNLRKHIAETLTKPTITDDLGLANGLDVVAAISHPELRNMEAGVSGFSIGELRPKSDLKMSLGEHPTYDTNIPGALIGQSKYPVPSEIAFPDTTAYARSRMTPGVQEFNMLKMLGPRERIDQQYIDEIKMYEELMKQYTGKKKGGLAQTKKVKRHGNTVPH